MGTRPSSRTQVRGAEAAGQRRKRPLQLSLMTAMSNPHLPAELLDHIVDLLDGSRDALESCCLVSKSWIPRARRHLFSRIEFPTPQNLLSWKTTFPDPSTSPAHYTRSLHTSFPGIVRNTDAKEGGWITTFSRVVYFEVVISDWDVNRPGFSLIPFHGFSPALNFLRVSFAGFTPSAVYGLIHSFPRLHSLDMTSPYWYGGDNGFHEQEIFIQPSGPLAFTGILKLSLELGMDPITSQLLSLPNGLHFRELHLTWNHKKDISLTAALAEKCSSTLETLTIKCELDGAAV